VARFGADLERSERRSMIRVMISSTVKDLEAERDAIKQGIGKISFLDLVGADPYNETALAMSSYTATLQLARECHLYILILGGRYGWEPAGTGRSATELEYDEAIRQDPTKVLVFRKKIDTVEPKQEAFINKVRDYFAGYWVTDFEYTHTLQEKVNESFLRWLAGRASLNTHLTYAEHFIRLALQRKTTDFESFEYSVGPEGVEIKSKVFKQKCSIRFSRDQVFNHFWQAVSELEKKFEEWRTKKPS
jgi:hypothetical protein